MFWKDVAEFLLTSIRLITGLVALLASVVQLRKVRGANRRHPRH